jgi:hypothetical protein
MFSLPAGSITDWFKALLGVEEVVDLLGLSGEKVEAPRMQGVI